METIERKSMLYKTGVEYGDYTMNHVLGCSHGCTYPCYAMLMAKRFGRVKDYREWCEPKLVSNAIELLKCEIPKLKGRIKNVQLCFTTDPFMYGQPEIADVSLEAIRLLNDAGIPCRVLTKGVLPVQLAGFSERNEYGISLVSLDESFREEYEPGSAPFDERRAGLRALHDRGCRTWVSMEPYPTPAMCDQSLAKVLESVSFVDRIIFGRMNYNRHVKEYPDYRRWYNERAFEVRRFCEERGIDCLVKKGTITDVSTAEAKGSRRVASALHSRGAREAAAV